MKKSATRHGGTTTGAQGKTAPRVETKRVWRISDRAPLGEWVDPNTRDDSAEPAAAGAATDPAAADAHGSWLESSMDLLRGVEVRHGNDTMPGELFDGFASTRPQSD